MGCVLPISAEAVSESLRKIVVEGISGDGPTTGLILVMGGILASLLPCVYPLYPITVGIIRARGEGSPKILHPAIYYLGLVVTYSCFGLIAGFSGGRLMLSYVILS
ncbi:cytochrome C biogenesis protein transmembrane region domain protein [Leptospira interrogans str. 2002000626]|uniref:Cytochrome C biogenesis protein transmembrane region domain protein n=1 Tax=Leptospira interrogans str. 2002000626 TaxID=996803 RepID=A0A829DD25_LEPIR|nr:cytochrome C biogenesis protein transmembrane region domain protein [Leptospira interrogans str. 2002000626]